MPIDQASCNNLGGSNVTDGDFCAELHEFAIELRKLAYMVPAGHEDRLIRLSEDMAWSAKRRRRFTAKG